MGKLIEYESIVLETKRFEELKNEAETHNISIVKLKELIAYGELQWDGQPFIKGMLEGLKEALKIMEGK